jgi:CyaY protein
MNEHTDKLTSDTMDEATFMGLAKDALDRIRDAVDACDPDVVECVPDADVVKVVFPTGLPYVLNTQRPVREIWLAADRNAWHFRYDGAHWLDKRSGDELMATIVRLVKDRAQVTIALA